MDSIGHDAEDNSVTKSRGLGASREHAAIDISIDNDGNPTEIVGDPSKKRGGDTEGTGRLSHGAKVKRGQLNAVQQGRYGTGPAPYGYRRGRENERPLVVVDREAEVVRTIFREYLRTRSTGKVVNYLHSRAIYTRKGNKWSRQAIAIILSNRTYRGRVSYGETETQGLHEPIIEPALFYKANALRDRKRRKRRP